MIPKDYWQPEDVGFIEETDGYPLPPSDEGGRPLEYIWIPSKSLRELSTACKRMAEALVGGEVDQSQRETQARGGVHFGFAVGGGGKSIFNFELLYIIFIVQRLDSLCLDAVLVHDTRGECDGGLCCRF